MNREKSGSGPTDESALLGFRLGRDGSVSVAPKAVAKLKTEVRRLWDARQSLTSAELRDQWAAYIRGWWEYFRLADSGYEPYDSSGWIRRHMRKWLPSLRSALRAAFGRRSPFGRLWLRWKTPKGRINALRRLGVNNRALGIAYTGLGAWRVARLHAMHQALKTSTLNRYGLIVPWDFAGARQ